MKPMTTFFKSKLVTCILSLFLPGTGLHWLYLKGFSSVWFYVQIFSLGLGLWGWSELVATDKESLLGWITTALGYMSLLASWLATLAFGLRPDELWDKQFNQSSTAHSQSGWLVILCVICALLIGAFVLMSGLAIAFEQYFTIQIEASRKISQ